MFHTATPIADNKAAIDARAGQRCGRCPRPGVTSPFSAAGAHQIAPDGNIAFALVQFTTGHCRPPDRRGQEASSPRRRPRPARASQVALGGNPISAAVTAAPGPSEGIGITAAMIIMLLAFGSVVAMGLPVLTALCGLGIGIALLELLTHLLVVPNFSPEMAAMIGIGVGIDYALFIVTRYRQGSSRGATPRDAVDDVAHDRRAGRCSSPGSTVVISLLGLFLIGQPYMIGLATGVHRRRAHRPGRRPHPAAGHARLRRRRHRQAAPAGPAAERRAATRARVLVPLEPVRPAPGLAHR